METTNKGIDSKSIKPPAVDKTPHKPTVSQSSEGGGAELGKEEPKKRGRPKDSKSGEPKRKKLKLDSKTKVKPPVRVNVDKQCGVPLVNSLGELTGLLCSRSLTCKTHSMGAKRSVRGRSRPYDVLLAAYQCRNNLKGAPNGIVGVKRLLNGSAGGALNITGGGNYQDDDDDKIDPPLPPAEELAAVINGARHSLPTPLARQILVPTRLRNEQISIRELLFKSISVPPPPPIIPGSSLASIMASTEAILGRCLVYNPMSDGVSLRPSQIYANTTMNNVIKEKLNDRKEHSLQYSLQNQSKHSHP